MWFNKHLEADIAAYNAAPTATTTKDPDTSYIVWGWVGVFLFAPLGIVMGIILMTRERLGHGISIFVLSTMWTLLVFALVLS